MPHSGEPPDFNLAWGGPRMPHTGGPPDFNLAWVGRGCRAVAIHQISTWHGWATDAAQWRSTRVQPGIGGPRMPHSGDPPDFNMACVSHGCRTVAIHPISTWHGWATDAAQWRSTRFKPGIGGPQMPHSGGPREFNLAWVGHGCRI